MVSESGEGQCTEGCISEQEEDQDESEEGGLTDAGRGAARRELLEISLFTLIHS